MKSPVLVIPLIVGCALLLEKMGENIIATSLPELALHFGYPVIALKLALTAYVVSLGMFIPVSGWVANKIGTKTVFRGAILTFMVGSLLCAVSQNLWMFVIARFFQGIAGAMMVPVGRLIIYRSVPQKDFVSAISYLALPAMLGPILGPPIGGFITTYFHWRWIFLINIPAGLLGLYLSGRFMQNFKEEVVPRLDKTGFLLSSVAGGCIMLGISFIGNPLVHQGVAILICVIGLIALYACYLYAHHVPNPMLDFKLLKLPAFKASVMGGSLFRFGFGAVPFLLPLTMQAGLHMNPFQSGLITCASAFGAITMKIKAASIIARFGFRRLLAVNAVLAGLMIASYSLFTANTPHWVMFLTILCGGFCPSLQFTCLNALSYADIQKSDAGAATSLASVAQQTSLGMGIGIGSLVLQFSSFLQGHDALELADFKPAFIVVGLFSIASSIFMLRIPKDQWKS